MRAWGQHACMGVHMGVALSRLIAAPSVASKPAGVQPVHSLSGKCCIPLCPGVAFHNSRLACDEGVLLCLAGGPPGGGVNIQHACRAGQGRQARWWVIWFLKTSRIRHPGGARPLQLYIARQKPSGQQAAGRQAGAPSKKSVKEARSTRSRATSSSDSPLRKG